MHVIGTCCQIPFWIGPTSGIEYSVISKYDDLQVRTVRIRLPRAGQLGAVQLLSEKDGFLLHSQLILLCPSPTLVTELNNLSSRDPHSASDFLSDLGLVMDSILDEVPKQALAARFDTLIDTIMLLSKSTSKVLCWPSVALQSNR